MTLRYTDKPLQRLQVEGLFIQSDFSHSPEEQVFGSCVFLPEKQHHYRANALVYFYLNETQPQEISLDPHLMYKDIILFALTNKMASIAIPISSSSESFSQTTTLDIISTMILGLIEKEKIAVTLVLTKKTSLEMKEHPKMNRIIQFINGFFEDHQPPIFEASRCVEPKMEDSLYFQKIVQENDVSPWLTETEKTFAELMIDWMIKKDIKNQDVWKKANIDRRLFSKILSGGHPSKKTTILLCLALELELDDALDLLSSAGYTLSHSIKEDLVVEWHIKHKLFSVFEVCATQHQLGLPSLF